MYMAAMYYIESNNSGSLISYRKSYHIFTIVQNLQSYAFILVACMDSLYLQESAQLHFTHTQREVAISLSISSHDLRTWVRPLQLLFWHTKH